ncbi:hypothetical protein BGZ99_009958 [Dissophora globulifera]|uniref:Peptidase A1 domain-containing protein n=1 Tax=Dissophora globulifera TaxID=979702 RepID=A0A9P6UMP9_9FUNG|nr:hypothetical protein BGZ99_009958 [Dissophora globulifera]
MGYKDIFGGTKLTQSASVNSQGAIVNVPMPQAFQNDISGYELVPMQGHVKHDLRNPAALTNRYLQKRDLSSTPLTNMVGDMAYSLELGLGTPVQTFRVMIDTGSPITWVIGTNCKGSKCESITDRFNPVASTSSNDRGSPFSINYVDGSHVSGEYYGETYTLGTLKFDGIIGAGSEYDTSTLPPAVDGLLGLWFTTFWQSLLNLDFFEVPFLNILGNSTNTILTDKVIGIWLEHQNSPDGIPANTSAGGEITFGGVNPARYTGDITYINCVGAAFGYPWSIPVGGITVDGQSIDVGVNTMAMIDTGTSLMLVPEKVSDAINSAIPGAQKDNVYSVFDFGTNADSGGRIGFGQLSNADFSDSGDSGNGTPGSHNSATSLLSLSLSVSATPILVGIAAVAAFIL